MLHIEGVPPAGFTGGVVPGAATSVAVPPPVAVDWRALRLVFIVVEAREPEANCPVGDGTTVGRGAGVATAAALPAGPDDGTTRVMGDATDALTDAVTGRLDTEVAGVTVEGEAAWPLNAC